MAKISKPPIPLKMYKHFAVATVSLTAGIAMFADSDNRQAVVEHVEEREQQAELRHASAQITGTPQLVRRDTQSGGAFGNENENASAPMFVPISTGGGAAPRRQPPRAARRVTVPGIDQARVDAMSEEEYQQFRASLPPELRGSQLSESEQARQRAAMEAASARRSGHSGRSADAPS